LTSLGLLVILIFFEDTNLYRLFLYKSELNKVELENKSKEEEIIDIRFKTSELTSNPEALEVFARETYYMKKDDEVVFIFKEKSVSK